MEHKSGGGGELTSGGSGGGDSDGGRKHVKGVFDPSSTTVSKKAPVTPRACSPEGLNEVKRAVEKFALELVRTSYPLGGSFEHGIPEDIYPRSIKYERVTSVEVIRHPGIWEINLETTDHRFKCIFDLRVTSVYVAGSECLHRP